MASESGDGDGRGWHPGGARFRANPASPPPVAPGSIAPALSHATRRRALRVPQADEATGARSATELAGELGLTVGDLAYHLKVLREHGLIWDEGYRPVRGATETFCRSLVAEDPQVGAILGATAREDERLAARRRNGQDRGRSTPRRGPRR